MHGRAFLSAFGPLIGSCGAEGKEEEDNGSRHYLLLSCRLRVRPHTLRPSQIRMHKWMYLHTRPERARTRSPSRRWCTRMSGECCEERGGGHTRSLKCWHIWHRKTSHFHASSHPHSSTLNRHPCLRKLSRTGAILHIQSQTRIYVFLCRCLHITQCAFLQPWGFLWFSAWWVILVCSAFCRYVFASVQFCLVSKCVYEAKHPGSTVSQAASRQAGLGHKPPG